MSENKKTGLSIAFWRKSTGNAMSHRGGLTADQVAEFQKLRVGDQLIIYKNTPKGDTSPDYSLRVFVPKPSDEF